MFCVNSSRKKRGFSSILFNISLIASMGLVGCSKNNLGIDPPEASGNSDSNAATSVDLSGMMPGKNMLRADEEAPLAEPAGDPNPADPATPFVFDNMKGVIISRSTVYHAGITYNEYLLFNPMSNLIYPGDVLVGNSISNGRYLPVGRQKVGEITWSTPDFAPIEPGYSFVKKVTDPNFSDYAAAMQAWNSIPIQPTATTTTFEVTEVNDMNEFSAKFGIGFEIEPVKAGFSIEGKVGELKTHILVKFVQKNYSVSMDIPRRPLLLDADIDSMDGVLPVYISDIFYGRLGYALISSDHEYWEVLAALQLGVPGISLEISSGYKEILDKSVTKYVVIGGSSNDHGYFVSEGWEGFKKAIAAPLHSYDAVPVAMTLRYADDNSVARVLFNGEYPVTESYFVKDCDEITFTFRPSTVQAKAANREDLYLWGHTVVRVPAELSGTGEMKEYRPVWIPMSKYIKLKKDIAEPYYPSEDVEVKLIRPKDMSMSEFLESRIEINAQFHNTNAKGAITGDDLGTRTISVKVQDLLFNAVHGGYTVSTRRNARQDYSVVVKFELLHDVTVLEEMPNTLVGVNPNDTEGTTRSTAANDANPFERVLWTSK